MLDFQDRRLMRRTAHQWPVSLCTLLLSAACSSSPEIQRPGGTLDLDTERPELMTAPEVPPYTGTDPVVLEAASRHGSGLELHKNVIVRTCGPTAGVCHNQKEYPDLHTASNLLDAIGAPCNVQPGDWSAVFDGCEQTGDGFTLGDSGKRREIAYVDLRPGDADYGDGKPPSAESAGLHVYLAEALDLGDRTRIWGNATFSRKFISDDNKVKETVYAGYQTEWWLLDGGRHLVGKVSEWQTARVESLLAQGIVQGDMNRNGVFGAKDSPPLHLLEAGNPERSYLVGRLRGKLGEDTIPGTRMPLANEPLSLADMLGLYCFIEGLPAQLTGEWDLLSPINYEDCTWADNPQELNLLGDNITWKGFVLPLLQANCGGCHGGENPISGFDVMSAGVYERMLLPSNLSGDVPLVTPGDVQASYLWLKLTGGEGMVGQVMPLDAQNSPRPLSEALLNDLGTWIDNGALAEE